MVPLILLLLFSLVFVPPSNAQHHHHGAAPTPQETTSGAPHVQFTVRPSEDAGAGVTPLAREALEIGFRVQDGQGGRGVGGIDPHAWILPREGGADRPNLRSCEEMVTLLLRGGVSADVHPAMNKMYILSLNADDTLSIINPKVNLNSANLMAVIPLKGKATNAFLDSRRGLVYVAMTGAKGYFGSGSEITTQGALGGNLEGKIVVVDVHTAEVSRTVSLEFPPRYVWGQPDGRAIWVGGDKGNVTIIDGVTHRVVGNLRVAGGDLDLAFDKDGRLAFLSSGEVGEVAVVETGRWEPLRRIRVQAGSLRLAHSPSRGLLYVSNGTTGGVNAIRVEDGSVVTTIPLAKGAASIHRSPDDRFLLAVLPEKRALAVIDLGENRIVQRAETGEEPDHLDFSDQYGFIRNRASSHITVFKRSDLGNGPALPVVEIPIGTIPPGESPHLPGVSPLAVMHGHGGALVANPADKTVYHYMEGMMAPMSAFKTYTAPPVGIFVYHRKMDEGPDAGDYHTRVRLEEAGTYDVYFYSPKPRAMACFELAVGGTSQAEERRVRPVVKVEDKEIRVSPGEPIRFKFSLVDESTGNPIEGLQNVRVMVFSSRGNWQLRRAARPLGGGGYEAELIFPRGGQYHLTVEAPSLGLRFGDIQHTLITVSSHKG
jgi:DNA-binding beta-propeller fold protein YncE